MKMHQHSPSRRHQGTYPASTPSARWRTVLSILLIFCMAFLPVRPVYAGDKACQPRDTKPDCQEYYISNNIPYYDDGDLSGQGAVCSSTANSATPASYTSGNGGNFTKPGTITLKGSNNAEKIMNFLLEQGFSLAGASGVLGNFSVESGFNPVALNKGSGAFGIAQWLGSRKTALQNYSPDYKTLETQLQFLMHELETTESSANSVKKATDPVQAAIDWELKFERSGQAAVSKRSSEAKRIFDDWSKNKTIPAASSDSSSSGSASGAGSDMNCTTGAAGGAGAGSGALGAGDLKGYAFPIAATKKSDLSTFGGALNQLPCYGSNCHHDGTYAFDLGVKGYGAKDKLFNPNSIGAPVYAISDGVITNRHDNAGSRVGCTQYTLKSSKDSHEWWYGHLNLNNAVAKQGQNVKAGQVLGYVGPSICADNTMPHLHIDSGGGYTSQRNDLVSKVVNGLYLQLGD